MRYEVKGYLLRNHDGVARWEEEVVGFFEEKDFPLIFEQGLRNGYNTIYYIDENDECHTLKSWIKENK